MKIPEGGNFWQPAECKTMVHDDYALEPVPADKTVSGFRIALVFIGIIIALPAFMSGAEIGFALGFPKGALSTLLGGLILSVIAMATGTVGAKMRLNTAMIAKLTFGTIGGKVVSAILALTMLGWFGVTAEFFGRSVQQILGDYGWNAMPAMAYTVVGGILMIVTTIFGFSALQRLSNITVPMLAVLIAYTAYVTMQRGPIGALAGAAAEGAAFGDGVSAIVGGLAVAVTVFPDFCRFSHTAADARIAAVLTFGFAMPAILLLAMIPSVITHERDLMVIMTTLGLGAPALALLVLKAWATNAGNLYSASLSAANVFSSGSQKWIIVAAGCIGIALAVAGISQKFIPFLIILGVCIPPIAGIYVVHFLGRDPANFGAEEIDEPPALRLVPFACWTLGIAVAVAARSGFITLTGIAACDSMLTAAASYFVSRRLVRLTRASAL